VGYFGQKQRHQARGQEFQVLFQKQANRSSLGSPAEQKQATANYKSLPVHSEIAKFEGSQQL
jgi:hypothetical protein